MTMMHVYLDGDPLDGAGSTLSSALAKAADAAGERLVIEAEADGALVPNDHLTEPPSNDPYAAELRLTSAHPRDLVSEALDEAAELLKGVEDAQRQAAELIQSGEIPQAMESLKVVLEGWSGAGRVMQLAEATPGVDMPDEVGGESIEALTKELARLLGEVRGAMAQQDMTSVADVLAYDMDTLCDSWARALGALSLEIGNAGS
jgi:hypothetical protein